MSKKKAKAGTAGVPGTFVGCLRYFLTPALFQQAHRAHHHGTKQRRCRWELHPLLLTLALFTWTCGDSQEERFAAARAFYVTALAPKRRRPGETLAGFQAALARVPMGVFRVFAAGLRRALLLKLSPWLWFEGFIPLGCDGSRLACPRTAELEQRLGTGGKAGGPPQAWLTALVHLGTGLLWSWRIGKANASERDHLERLLPTLPAGALVVTDAGYWGVRLARVLLGAGVDFLMRVGSQTKLYVARVPDDGWSDGTVLLWPEGEQRGQRLPLSVRLIRLHDARKKVDVWLLTNVLQPGRLSVATAAQFYRMRWENEGFFRTYKRTLKMVKLSSRTVALLHREIEGSLLAVQLLLSQGVWARATLSAKQVRCSPRQLLLAIRQEIREAHQQRGRGGYRARLGGAGREDRPHRKSAKMKRQWPARQDHQPPKPPELRTLTDDLIARLHKILGVS